MRVKWSQNFLADRGVARKCVNALELGGGETVLEIGPGRGVLTSLLLDAAAEVIAVEIDPELAEGLETRFSGLPLTVVRSDFLEADLDAWEALRRPGLKVIGNLPYAVTSPILQKLLAWPKWETAVVMMQKEVGDRILAKPGGKEYGVLTVSVQSRCRTERVFNVSPRCFRPAPQVDSVVLRLRPLAEPLVPAAFQPKFFSVVRAGFAHRRKTVLNSLGHEIDRPAAELREVLERSKIDPGARAETLSIADFKRLTEILYP